MGIEPTKSLFPDPSPVLKTGPGTSRGHAPEWTVHSDGIRTVPSRGPCWPFFRKDGRIAAGYGGGLAGGVVLFDPKRDRVRPKPLEVPEGDVTSVAFDSQGRIGAGYGLLDIGGGVLVFEGDPISWHQTIEKIVNRNFTWEEWGEFFPDQAYRATFPKLPTPTDVTGAERSRKPSSMN